MHERLSVSGISTMSLTLIEQIDFWHRHDIDRVGVTVRGLEESPAGTSRRLRDEGFTVTNLLGHGPRLDDRSGWDEHRDLLQRSLKHAAEMEAHCFVVTTGPAGTMPWEEAAEALRELLLPVLPWASCPILVEHTHSLRADVGFAHTLTDALDLAELIGIDGVLLEVQACWAERGLARTIASRIDGIGLVQLSDYRIGTTSTPHRLVPGDGDLPLARMIGQLEAAGYTGDYDLELIGPAIEAEGYEYAIPRAVAEATRLLP